MAEIDRVEVLLQLANNQRSNNEEWRQQVWRETVERIKALRDSIARVEKEYGLLNQELHTLQSMLPPQQEPMPRAVTQGPRNPNEPVRDVAKSQGR